MLERAIIGLVRARLRQEALFRREQIEQDAILEEAGRRNEARRAKSKENFARTVQGLTGINIRRRSPKAA